jgi:small conductance mechanosensitive channel
VHGIIAGVIHTLLNFRLWDESVVLLARVTGTLVLAWLVHRFAGRLARVFRERVSTRISDPEHLRRAETLARAFRYLSSVVISLIAGMLVLSELGISVAPILGAAGVVGLAVGFGAQSLVKDYVSGFFLLLENQLTRGDVVEVVGKSGTVEDVTLRFVQLRDYEGNLHFIPNGLITTVTNMSRGYAYAALEVTVPYAADLALVFTCLAEVAQGMRAEPKLGRHIFEPLEVSGVERLEAAGVVVRCRMRVQPLERWDVRREFARRVKEEFARRGIMLPAAQLIPAVLAAPPPAPGSPTR